MEIQNKQRPLFITMLCSFYFVYWAISIIGLIAALLMNIGPQFPAFSKIANQIQLIFLGVQIDTSMFSLLNPIPWLIVVGLVVGVIGYWLFQKWAVIIYAAASIALFIVALPATSSVSTKVLYVGLILYVLASMFAINIALIVLGIINFKRMK